MTPAPADGAVEELHDGLLCVVYRHRAANHRYCGRRRLERSRGDLVSIRWPARGRVRQIRNPQPPPIMTAVVPKIHHCDAGARLLWVGAGDPGLTGAGITESETT